MKGWMKWIAGTLGLSALVHLGAVIGVPRGIMLVVKRATAAIPSRIIHGDVMTASSRVIVRPSPDLLYSLCWFDVSRRPLRISAPVPPGTYFSIAAYASNTDNFFVVNDRELAGLRADLVLVRSSEGTHAPSAGERVVRSPTDEGVVLFRTLITDRGQLDRLRALQRQADCRPL